MMPFDEALQHYHTYEDQLRVHAPHVVERLAPPHPDPAAAVAAVLPGLVLPDELVAWWSWHDGMTPPVGYAPALGPSLRFFSLQRALKEWRECCEMAQVVAEPPEMPAEFFWPVSFMPVMGNERVMLSVDLSPRAPRAGVIYKESDVMAHHSPVIAGGLAEVVSWWTRLLTLGATTWQSLSSGSGYWVTDRSRVPDDLLGNPAAYIDLQGPRDPRFLPLG